MIKAVKAVAQCLRCVWSMSGTEHRVAGVTAAEVAGVTAAEVVGLEPAGATVAFTDAAADCCGDSSFLGACSSVLFGDSWLEAQARAPHTL